MECVNVTICGIYIFISCFKTLKIIAYFPAKCKHKFSGSNIKYRLRCFHLRICMGAMLLLLLSVTGKEVVSKWGEKQW